MDSGPVINFKLTLREIPHLLGLQHLKDIDLLNQYKNGTKGATDILKAILDDGLSSEQICSSRYFDTLYENRIRHLNPDSFLNLIYSGSIVEFHPEKIHKFVTKLNNTRYMLWKKVSIGAGAYLHMAIGFQLKNKRYYPNSFFAEKTDVYLEGQPQRRAMSRYLKFRDGREYLKTDWEVVRSILAETANLPYRKEIGEWPNKDKEFLLSHMAVSQMAEVLVLPPDTVRRLLAESQKRPEVERAFSHMSER